MSDVRKATRVASVMYGLQPRIDSRGPLAQGRLAVMCLSNSPGEEEYFAYDLDSKRTGQPTLAGAGHDVQSRLKDLGYEPEVVHENGRFFLVI